MVAQFEVQVVNKFDANWAPAALFRNFHIRVVLKDDIGFILQINLLSKLKKQLISDIGFEDENWFIDEREGRCELYLVNSSVLLIWKLRDFNDFFSMFNVIEYHQIGH